MAKIQLMDTMPDVVLKMAEGNPGACACIMEMISKRDWYANVDPIMMILMLDEIGVYGDKLYKLWNDCCGRDLVQLELVLRNFQTGHLPKDVIKRNVMQVRGIPFLGLIPLEQLFARPV